MPDSAAEGAVPAPLAAELDRLVLAAPPMTGAEYLTAEVLGALWQELDAAFGIELAESKCGIQEFLKRRNPAWNLVGRVHFNLAENRKDPDAPFAFLATYTTRLVGAMRRRSICRWDKALGEYAGAANKDRLLSLLLPVQRASRDLPVAEGHGRCGRDLPPAALDARRGDCSFCATSRNWRAPGVVVRMPATWRGNRPPRPQVTATIGGKRAVGTGPGRAARFPDGSHARWRTLDRRRDPGAAGEIGRAGAGARPLGRGGSRAAAAA